MATWQVNLVDGSKRTFYDISQILGQYYKLQPEWIKKLQVHIKQESAYQISLSVINSVSGPQGASLHAPFLLLLITKTRLTVTLLGELAESGAGCIKGIWPKTFLKILETDEKAILNMLYIISEQPQLVEKLELYF